MRRDKHDIQWQTAKEKVRSRDKVDRIRRILTIKEELLLRKRAPHVQLLKLDVAHIFPVSIYPDLMYDLNNMVLLNRFSHECLDNMRDPITGEPFEAEEGITAYDKRQAWWERIANSQWQKILNRLGDSQIHSTERSS